jgi:hypothetical protein
MEPDEAANDARPRFPNDPEPLIPCAKVSSDASKVAVPVSTDTVELDEKE